MIDPLEFRRLQAIGLKAQMVQQLVHEASHGAGHTPIQNNGRDAAEATPRLQRVIEVQREGVSLHDGDIEVPARLLPALRNALSDAEDAIAVGDWVLAAPDAFGQWWVRRRLTPTTQIARRQSSGRDKLTRAVIVSNVDTALLVMGLDHDFNLRRLERYLALVRMAGVDAVVVLTKADQCADVEFHLDEVRGVLPRGASVIAVNALSDEASRALAPWLSAGQTLALLGSSGAGKSTLTNALLGQAVQDTGANRDHDSRGRHTTTARTLHAMPGGACIIDTPGLRTLRLDSEAGDVAGVFDDITEAAMHCRFRDCKHEDEPGCAVRAGVPEERVRNYHKLLRESQRDRLTIFQRHEQLAMWKSRSRAARVNMKAKRG